MRAALLEKTQQPLALVNDVQIESPRAREVVVRVTHCGICHSDLTMIDAPGGGQIPCILGHEAAGLVEEVGGSVTRLKRGDKVMLTPIPSCGANRGRGVVDAVGRTIARFVGALRRCSRWLGNLA